MISDKKVELLLFLFLVCRKFFFDTKCAANQKRLRNTELERTFRFSIGFLSMKENSCRDWYIFVQTYSFEHNLKSLAASGYGIANLLVRQPVSIPNIYVAWSIYKYFAFIPKN